MALKKTVVFLIDSDPRISHRPAEAIRIAAGVAVGHEVQVHLCFAGPATLCLINQIDDLPDTPDDTSYLSLVRQEGGKVHLLSTPSREIPQHLMNPTAESNLELTEGEFAELTANSDCLLRF